MAIKITRLDRSAEDLRREACRVSDCAQSRRLLALASILDGASRSDAAKSAGMDRQTLRDWVHRYNAEGMDGLKDRQRTGRKPLLGKKELSEFDGIVETQPDPVKDGVVRWRCADLKHLVKERWNIELGEVSIGRILKELGFSHISPRPRHPKQEEGVIEAFKKTSTPRWTRH